MVGKPGTKKKCVQAELPVSQERDDVSTARQACANHFWCRWLRHENGAMAFFTKFPLTAFSRSVSLELSSGLFSVPAPPLRVRGRRGFFAFLIRHHVPD
jgi:hypothetical protein